MENGNRETKWKTLRISLWGILCTFGVTLLIVTFLFLISFVAQSSSVMSSVVIQADEDANELASNIIANKTIETIEAIEAIKTVRTIEELQEDVREMWEMIRNLQALVELLLAMQEQPAEPALVAPPVVAPKHEPSISWN